MGCTAMDQDADDNGLHSCRNDDINKSDLILLILLILLIILILKNY